MYEKHLVATYEQLGQFEVRSVNGELRKNGGNVAGYFCTPSGRVIHAVAGPVSADELLAATRWTLDVFRPIADKSLHRQRQHLAQQHADVRWSGANWIRPSGRQDQLHELFASQPLVHLEFISEQVFTSILGQRISRSVGALASARQGLQRAQESGRPILFTFHGQGSNDQASAQWSVFAAECKRHRTEAMLALYTVILLPLREMPALSEQLKILPYEAPDRSLPLFVVADQHGRQTGAATGRQAARFLQIPMARTLVASLEDRPRPDDLHRAYRAIRRFDRRWASQITRLVRRTQKAADRLDGSEFLATAEGSLGT